MWVQNFKSNHLRVNGSPNTRFFDIILYFISTDVFYSAVSRDKSHCRYAIGTRDVGNAALIPCRWHCPCMDVLLVIKLLYLYNYVFIYLYIFIIWVTYPYISRYCYVALPQRNRVGTYNESRPERRVYNTNIIIIQWIFATVNS